MVEGRAAGAPLPGPVPSFVKELPEVICKVAVGTVPVFVGGVKKGRITPF